MEKVVRSGSSAERPALRVRGRPAQISRQYILHTALAILEKAPESPPSLNGIARELGVTPMSIYTYFTSRDELWQALSEALLSDFVFELQAGTDPMETIALWTQAVRRHFIARPQLINMLSWEGGHSSVGWLNRSVIVFDALAALGLEGEALGRATYWVWTVVMGAINVELANRNTSHALAAEEFERLEPEIQHRVALVLSSRIGPGYEAEVFTYKIDRMLEAIRLMAPRG